MNVTILVATTVTVQQQQQSKQNNKKKQQLTRQAHEPWLGCASCIPFKLSLHTCMQDYNKRTGTTHIHLRVCNIYLFFFLSNNLLMCVHDNFITELFQYVLYLSRFVFCLNLAPSFSIVSAVALARLYGGSELYGQNKSSERKIKRPDVFVCIHFMYSVISIRSFNWL